VEPKKKKKLRRLEPASCCRKSCFFHLSADAIFFEDAKDRLGNPLADDGASPPLKLRREGAIGTQRLERRAK
jgi:hypothetical protein